MYTAATEAEGRWPASAIAGSRSSEAGGRTGPPAARESLWEGPSFGYETLNLVDGERSVGEIRDQLAATVGPAPVEEVAAYLAILERLGVIRR